MKKLLSTIFLLLFLNASFFAQENKTSGKAVQEQNAKMSYGIVVDNSGSFRLILEKVVQIVKDIIKENNEDDETFLVRFISSEKIKVVQDFTVNKDEISDAADSLYVEGGQTAILDAVMFSAEYLVENAMKDSGRRKILIIISDGDDRQNAAKTDEVLKYLKENNIRVFAFGIAEEKVSTKILDKLTKETGGKTFVPKTRADIGNSVKSLTTAVRIP